MSVLQRPTYSSTIGVEREKWLADNDEDIRSWYIATSEAVPEEHLADYREFSLVQFDIARDLDERLHDELYEAQLAESDAEDEPREDGECFRGGEAAAYEAEQQAWIQRNLK